MILHTAPLTRITRAAVVALVISTIAAPVSFAQEAVKDGAIPTVRVDYSDLNLSTEKGSRTLYKRLRAAALRVCPERSDTLLALGQNRDAERCVASTVQQAVSEIKHPRFTELAAKNMW